MGNCGSSGGGTVRELSSKEKTDIRESWTEFASGNIVEDGAHLYFKMFKEHPELIEKFSFAKGRKTATEEMLENRQFRNHVEKVWNVIGSAVKEMNDLSELGQDLIDLGARHYTYGITMKQYAFVAQGIMHALERKLGPAFTPDRKKAWVNLYAHVEAAMRVGMERQSRESRAKSEQ